MRWRRVRDPAAMRDDAGDFTARALGVSRRLVIGEQLPVAQSSPCMAHADGEAAWTTDAQSDFASAFPAVPRRSGALPMAPPAQ